MKAVQFRRNLEVFHSFKASHSLAGFETPHFHLWRISLTFVDPSFVALGFSKRDRVIDLVELQELIAKLTKPLENTYLNTTLGRSPTSENLCEWIWEQWANLPYFEHLQSISIELSSLDQVAMGRATISRVQEGFPAP